MLDFSSALYLGMYHSSHELRPWRKMTSGTPAALEEPESAGTLAREIATLQGCERSLLAPSTLHLFWDWFGHFPPERTVVLVDDGVYPIGRWGTERAAFQGVKTYQFRHYDPESLALSIKRGACAGRNPVILADGFCPASGRGIPLKEYLALAVSHGGLLVIDDTQALGIHGCYPDKTDPYGRGGGGTLCMNGLGNHPSVLLISSLAKAFGAPIAAISGSRRIIENFSRQSKTRVHCGPPSMAAVHAALNALKLNKNRGDNLRRQLAKHVLHFKGKMKEMGLKTTPGIFPVQTVYLKPGTDVSDISQHLLHYGVKTVLHQWTMTEHTRLSFILRADHTTDEISKAAEIFSQCYTDCTRAQKHVYYRSIVPTYLNMSNGAY